MMWAETAKYALWGAYFQTIDTLSDADKLEQIATPKPPPTAPPSIPPIIMPQVHYPATPPIDPRITPLRPPIMPPPRPGQRFTSAPNSTLCFA